MVIILMGVTGSGKTTVGRLLGEELGWNFYDADDFHPRENVEKMSKGIPLTDEDRGPWLDALAAKIESSRQESKHIILACSALKEAYRTRLRRGLNDVFFVYLKGGFELIKDRLEARQNHFMDPKLLSSQFAALEEPSPENAIFVDISPNPELIADAIVKEIRPFLNSEPPKACNLS